MVPTQSSIIVLENDSSLSRAMERVLQAAGFATRAFRTVEEFAQDDAAHDAACVILDGSVAARCGTALSEHLRIEAGTPLIFISGYDDPESHALAADTGAAVFLATPFPGRRLVEVVHRLLHERQATLSLATAGLGSGLEPQVAIAEAAC